MWISDLNNRSTGWGTQNTFGSAGCQAGLQKGETLKGLARWAQVEPSTADGDSNNGSIAHITGLFFAIEDMKAIGVIRNPLSFELSSPVEIVGNTTGAVGLAR